MIPRASRTHRLRRSMRPVTQRRGQSNADRGTRANLARTLARAGQAITRPSPAPRRRRQKKLLSRRSRKHLPRPRPNNRRAMKDPQRPEAAVPTTARRRRRARRPNRRNPATGSPRARELGGGRTRVSRVWDGHGEHAVAQGLVCRARAETVGNGQQHEDARRVADEVGSLSGDVSYRCQQWHAGSPPLGRLAYLAFTRGGKKAKQ